MSKLNNGHDIMKVPYDKSKRKDLEIEIRSSWLGWKDVVQTFKQF